MILQLNLKYQEEIATRLIKTNLLHLKYNCFKKHKITLVLFQIVIMLDFKISKTYNKQLNLEVRNNNNNKLTINCNPFKSTILNLNKIFRIYFKLKDKNTKVMYKLIGK